MWVMEDFMTFSYMTSPYVATSDLMALRLDWPAVVLSGMVRHQLELEQMRHECKK